MAQRANRAVPGRRPVGLARAQRSVTGFTLIEVMLVTLILTALASVVLPNFTAFRARSARAEAKTLLAGIAQAELAHYGEHLAFTDDLARLNWALSGSPRFLVGFTSDTSSTTRNDTGELLAHGVGHFNGVNLVDAFGIPLTESELPTAEVSRDSFTVGAVGNLDFDPTLDRWLLTREGELENVTDEVSQ